MRSLSVRSENLHNETRSTHCLSRISGERSHQRVLARHFHDASNIGTGRRHANSRGFDQRSQALTRVVERQRRKADARPPKRTDLVDSAAPSEVAAGEPLANAPAPLPAPLNAPGETAAEAPVLAIAARPEAAQVPIAGGAAWRIQLASLNSRNDTEAEWTRLQQANRDLLRGLTLHVQQADLSKGTFYRVQAGPLVDQATAASLCNSLKSRNQDCLIVIP